MFMDWKYFWNFRVKVKKRNFFPMPFSNLIKWFQFRKDWFDFLSYITRRLIGWRIIESAAHCNHKLLALLYLISTQNTSVNWIFWILLSLFCWSKVILISGGHCSKKKIWFWLMLKSSCTPPLDFRCLFYLTWQCFNYNYICNVNKAH